ncbi:MAG: prolyl oligopeptidase family serine peptidase [archaeon]|nr:prolyl oligopeptidase family serine peptidase [archaeon]
MLSLIKDPILDKDAIWKKRFRLPRIMVQFASSNPNHVLVISNQTGTYELYAYDLPSNTLRQATKRPSGTAYGSISPDGNHIYFMDDKKGNETGHVVRIPFDSTKSETEDLTPSLEDYTLAEPFIDDTSSHFGITIPNKDGFDSYVVEISGESIGKPKMINRNKKMSFGPLFSHDGKLCVVNSSERFGGLDFSVLSFDTQSGNKLLELADESSRIDICGFSPMAGDPRILVMSNRSGVMRPLLWDVVSGTRNDLKIDLEGDVVGMAWSPNAKSVLLCQTDKATTQLWLYDLESGKLNMVVHPEGLISAACFKTNDTLLVSWQDSTNPAQILEIALSNPSSRPKSYLSPKDVPKSRSWNSATVHSSDGEEIQFWYATPEGEGPFPLILETHGGPTSAQFNSYMPRSQVWLDHGFAYTSVNYRGSTTFGKGFEKKINGDLGHWEVEDMVAARNWLIQNKIARPKEIFLTGWSYGGYLTLQGMSLYPELWAGGMGGVVVADWVSLYEDEPEAMRGYEVALHGGNPSERKESYEKSSPINYLEKLAAPLLIIQGKNDVRCPPRQVELYEAKAKTLGKDVKVVWFDTGHAGSGIDIELAISHTEIMLRWVYDALSSK